MQGDNGVKASLRPWIRWTVGITAVILLFGGWPLSLLGLFTTLGCVRLQDAKVAVAKASKDFLFAVSIGLIAVCLVQTFLSLRTSDSAPVEALRSLEYGLIAAKLQIKACLKKVTAWVLAAVLTGAWLVSMLHPRIHSVTWLLNVRKVLSHAWLALAVATSFTFFVEQPVENAFERLETFRAARIRALYREQDDTVARHFATETLRRTLSHLDEASKERLKTLWEAVESENEASIGYFAGRLGARDLIIHRFAKQDAEVLTTSEAFNSSLKPRDGEPAIYNTHISKADTVESSELGQAPKTVEQAEEQAKLEEALRSEVAALRFKSAEAKKGLRDVTAKIAVTSTILMSAEYFPFGIPGRYCEMIISELAKSAFDRINQRWASARQIATAREAIERFLDQVVPEPKALSGIGLTQWKLANGKDVVSTTESVKEAARDAHEKAEKIIERENALQRERTREMRESARRSGPGRRGGRGR